MQAWGYPVIQKMDYLARQKRERKGGKKISRLDFRKKKQKNIMSLCLTVFVCFALRNTRELGF